MGGGRCGMGSRVLAVFGTTRTWMCVGAHTLAGRKARTGARVLGFSLLFINKKSLPYSF